MRHRLLLLGELLLNTPLDARQTLPTRLAAALHGRGHLVTGKLWHDDIDPVITTRILALISVHTGVDLATLTTAPAQGSATPAVAHARLLAAALLRRGRSRPGPLSPPPSVVAQSIMDPATELPSTTTPDSLQKSSGSRTPLRPETTRPDRSSHTSQRSHARGRHRDQDTRGRALHTTPHDRSGAADQHGRMPRAHRSHLG